MTIFDSVRINKSQFAEAGKIHPCLVVIIEPFPGDDKLEELGFDIQNAVKAAGRKWKK